MAMCHWWNGLRHGFVSAARTPRLCKLTPDARAMLLCSQSDEPHAVPGEANFMFYKLVVEKGLLK